MMAPKQATYYLAYYELHEIPWELAEPIKFKVHPSGMQLQIGRGPYAIPRAASPTVVTRAGGATVEWIHENYVLEGGTYLGIAIPTERDWQQGGPLAATEWDRLAGLADDAASLVGLCLDQRIALNKVAEYIWEQREDGTSGRMEFRIQMFAGARASVSEAASRSIAQSMDHVLGDQVSPQTLVALRWLEQSKKVTVGPDRFLALWIALEALMSPTRNHGELMRKTARHLARKEFKLGLDARHIVEVLGLYHMRRVRNEIIHEGARLLPWPVADDPTKRDWPQILNEIVGEILRQRLGVALTGSLQKHVLDGLKRNQRSWTKSEH